MQDIELAIIDSNTLVRMGLQSLLEEILPKVTVRSFGSFDELMADTPYYFVHYFVSANIFFEHASFFREQGRKTILLVQNQEQAQRAGLPSIDVTQSESHLVQQLIRLREMGRQMGGHSQPDDSAAHGTNRVPPMSNKGVGTIDSRSFKTELNPQMQPELSLREIEVLQFLVKGLTNKEIADKLNISLTTVITHRKNIQEKTGIKSLSGLTVYAVFNGHIDIDEI